MERFGADDVEIYNDIRGGIKDACRKNIGRAF